MKVVADNPFYNLLMYSTMHNYDYYVQSNFGCQLMHHASDSEEESTFPQEIGVKYGDFGLLLLEDHSGARIRALALKHMKM